MAYVQHRVAPGVDLWQSTSPPGVQRILPDGCLDLLFDGTRLLVAGPAGTAQLHHGDQTLQHTAIRLHGGRGAALLGIPASELLDQLVPLADIWDAAAAREQTERVAASPVTALTGLALATVPDPLGPRLHALLAAGGSVSRAADALGYSTRQLQRRSQEQFGYGPQHLLRVLRLGRAVALADHGLSWATVAARAGYTDQAHLSRDVTALTGTTPTQLRRERVRSVQDAA